MERDDDELKEYRETLEKILLKRATVFSVIASLVMSVALPVLGQVLFTVPLIVLSERYRHTGKALLPLLGTYALMALVQFVELREYLDIYAVLMVFPTLSTVAAAMWIGLRESVSSHMRRMFFTAIPVAVLCLAIAFLVHYGKGDAFFSYCREFFQSLVSISPDELYGVDAEYLVSTVKSEIVMTAVPMGMAFSFVGVLVAECFSHRRLDWWQSEMACLRMPPVYTWIAITLMIACVVCAKGLKLEGMVFVALFNLALGLMLLLAVQGWSACLSLLRRRKAGLGAGAFMLIILAVALAGSMLVPYAALLLLVLPLVAVAEAVFKLR